MALDKLNWPAKQLSWTSAAVEVVPYTSSALLSTIRGNSPRLFRMFRKKTRRLVSLLTAMILVWSQFMVVAYACPQLIPSEPASTAMESAMPPDCAQMGQKDNQPSPLCKAHCEQSPQSNQTPSLDLPPAALAAIPGTPRFDLAGLQLGPTIRNDSLCLTDGSPPLRIQYQVFRI